nr:hypothetical protein [Planctomycetota bacterium]
MVWCAALLLPALLAPSAQVGDAPAARTEVFVSPDGSDAADGSRARPFATLERAIAELELRGGPRPTLTLLDGSWSLDRGLRLGPRHDGWTLRAAAGARPVLLGGLRLREPELLPVRDPEVLRRLPDDDARAAVRELPLPAGAALAPPVHRGMGAPVVAVGSELIGEGAGYRRGRWPNEGSATA